MAAAQERKDRAAQSPFLEAFEEVSEAVESGAGLPAVARAAGHALDASVVVLGADSAVLAVACLSPEDERAVLAGEGETEVIDLRVADERAGQLRLRARGAPPPASLLRIVSTLIGQEVDRARAPERASEAAVADFLSDLLGRKVTDRENISARSEELGCDLADGAAVIVARARPQHPEEGDWRARVLAVAERGARGSSARRWRRRSSSARPGRARTAPRASSARRVPTRSWCCWCRATARSPAGAPRTPCSRRWR